MSELTRGKLIQAIAQKIRDPHGLRVDPVPRNIGIWHTAEWIVSYLEENMALRQPEREGITTGMISAARREAEDCLIFVEATTMRRILSAALQSEEK